ncbi:hypothetical protein [Duganella violaceipulchra]|uniref:Amidohydrolase n=1 Tax=Duganella violaceipulchra TaxID=2849652 RepID=A0AA41KZY1_9BURK|nr:hypothetical protein [Duganella violaceicalia]MBV6321626.1 hypothetical protein [Duganella violaceicalia]MCP2008114.1 putative amidohydrolase [Duganella violaceicalia]
MMPPDNQLEALWSIVEPLVRADLHAEALCYAGLAIAWRDTSYYAKLLCERGVSESSVQYDAKLIGTEFDGGGPGLLELVRKSPLGLLSWLDQRLASPVIGAPHTYSNTVYLGDVIPCKIRPDVARLLDFPAFWVNAYLVRRRGDRDKQGRIAQQGLSQHRFTPRWFVMPDTPDPSQRARKIEIVSAESTFRYACQEIQARGRMNIYVAEFAVPPEFASTFSVVGENQYWAAQGLHNEALIAADAVAHVRRAASVGADVLIFPELTIPPLVRDAIANELSSSRTGIALVVAGSFHEAIAGSVQVRNISHLLDGLGNPVKLRAPSASRNWTHDKFNPVRLAHPGAPLLQEDLHAGNLITLVNTPIGLQSIITCLDLAQSAVISSVRVEYLPQQFLWIPSMSESVSAHRDHAKTIHLNHATVIACANQAQANFGNDIAIRGDAMGSFVHGAQTNQTTTALEFAKLFVVTLQSSPTSAYA